MEMNKVFTMKLWSAEFHVESERNFHFLDLFSSLIIIWLPGGGGFYFRIIYMCNFIGGYIYLVCLSAYSFGWLIQLLFDVE